MRRDFLNISCWDNSTITFNIIQSAVWIGNDWNFGDLCEHKKTKLQNTSKLLLLYETAD
jgi:hypothetical protein